MTQRSTVERGGLLGKLMLLQVLIALVAGAAVWATTRDGQQLTTMLISLALIFLGGMCLIIVFLYRGVLLPLGQMTRAIQEVKAGDPTVRVAQADRRDDECGRLAREINALIKALEQAPPPAEVKREERDVVQLLEIVSKASEGDLSARGEVTHDAMGSVTDAFNHMLGSIGRLVLEVRRSGMEVTTSAERILSLSETMASSAAKQSIVLNLVTKKIGALGERSLEINQIVELIDEISAQTNMLALNAAIEASRAGTQGKGFAVVANEVRKLAERTSNATKDIGAFIQSIQEATEDAVRAMEEIRSETRLTADGALDTSRAADEMVDAARELGMTIGRFKVHRRDSEELAQDLENKRQEIRRGIRMVLDLADVAAAAGPSSRLAAEQLLEDLEELTASAQRRIKGVADDEVGDADLS